MSTAEVRDPACVERWPDCKPGAYDPRCCRFPKSCSCATWQGSPADAPADAAWADLLLAIFDEHGAVTPKVGAALARYRATVSHAFYVESTSAWHTLADRHLSDGGATGALACALVTLIDAYEHARSETTKPTDGGAA